MLVISSYWFSVCFILLASFFPLVEKGGSLQAFSLDDLSVSLSGKTELLASVFLFSVCFIACLVYMYSRYYMSEKSVQDFYLLVLFFVTSMLSLIISDSMFLIFLGWEGLGVSSFLLIVFYQNWVSLGGASFTIMTNRIGDVLLVMMFFYTLFLGMKPVKFSLFLLLVLMIISFTKSAQWPFSSWLPAAMAAPTPVSSLVHSSTLVTAGIWLLIRFSVSLQLYVHVLLILGLFTLTMASVSALKEIDLKKLVALSTLSQLGLMVAALSVGGKLICLFHLIAHAFAKAGLFLIVGAVIHNSFSSQDWRESNLLKPMVFYLFLSLFMLSLSGLLFTSGFFSKESILVFFSKKLSSFFSGLLIALVVAPTVAYSYKLSKSVSTIHSFKTVDSSNSFSQLMPVTLLFLTSLIFSYFFLKNLSFFLVLPLSMVNHISSFIFIFYFMVGGLLWFYLVVWSSISINFLFHCESFFIFLEKSVETIEVWHVHKLLTTYMKNVFMVILSLIILAFLWLYF